MAHGVLYTNGRGFPLSPLSSQATALPFSFYVFTIAGSTTPLTVYTDGNILVPYASNVVTADSTGKFAPIFLDTTKIYRVQMFDQFNRRILDIDPYITPLTVFGTTQLAFNQTLGQVTITPTQPGGTGASLTIFAKNSGIALNTGGAGFQPGGAELQLLNTGLTGSTIATFTATNKPGLANGSVNCWMPINVNGALFFIPLFN